jgi:demethylmenaquinone methyltransferase/2-methoxy-6-polyprenyl-1,4-benzoquinol methylase
MPQTEIAPVTRTTEDAKATYDRLSKYYDTLATSSEGRYIDLGLEMLDIQEGKEVLEIGFGAGYATLQLARSVGEGGKVYGLDISEGMYRVTRDKLAKAGLLERAELKVGDAQEMPFPAATMDAVFMSFTLELFDTPQIPVVLDECRRVLRDGGRLCVVSLSKDRALGVVGRLYEWLHTQFPRYLDCRPIPVQELLREAGFALADVRQASMWGLPVSAVLAKPDGRRAT